MTKKWGHDELAADLAQHLRASTGSIVWENMQLGPSGSARPDLYRLERSFAKPRPCVYEVKISRADFLRDVGAGKWLNYFDFAEVVYFAAPAGLLTKADVPNEAGLFVRHESGWRGFKTARPRRLECIPEDTCLKLLIDGIDRQVTGRVGFGTRNLKDLRRESVLCAAATKKFGRDAAKLMGNWTDLKREVAYQEERTARYREKQVELEQSHRDRLARLGNEQLGRMRSILELADDADEFDIAAAVSLLARRLRESEVVDNARQCLTSTLAATQRHAEMIATHLAQMPQPRRRSSVEGL